MVQEVPKHRLPTANHYRFYTTGLDFIGPFSFYDNNNRYLRYILLFTCLVARAVHLEGSPDLSTNSTIHCIISDNASSSFFSANKVLKSSVSDLAQSFYFEDKLSLIDIDIEKFFNPPAVPLLGGSWERLVQFFKLSLYNFIGSQTLHDNTLNTFFAKSVPA